MKALSLTQPWAQLVAIGAKMIETRSWSTGYRWLVAIHASKGFPRTAKELAVGEPFIRQLRENRAGHFFAWDVVESLPRGAIVAVVNLWDCRNIGPDRRSVPTDERELAFGDFSPGRWMWFLGHIRRLSEPIPCKGALGLWTVPAEIEARIRQQVGLWERKGDAHG